MTVKKIERYEYQCDNAQCDFAQVSSSGRPDGWGVVRVYDNKIHRDEIGDQNGWNNFDLCPTHYSVFMASLGIDAHNIPDCPDDAG